MFKIDRENFWFIATYQNKTEINWKELSNQEDIEQFLIGLYVRYSKMGAQGLRNHFGMEYFEKNHISKELEKTIEDVISSVTRNDLDSESLHSQEAKEFHIDEFIMIIENLQKYKQSSPSKILKF